MPDSWRLVPARKRLESGRLPWRTERAQPHWRLQAARAWTGLYSAVTGAPDELTCTRWLWKRGKNLSRKWTRTRQTRAGGKPLSARLANARTLEIRGWKCAASTVFARTDAMSGVLWLMSRGTLRVGLRLEPRNHSQKSLHVHKGTFSARWGGGLTEQTFVR
jgi:hypothetical protein